jgi:hypothetical protein
MKTSNKRILFGSFLVGSSSAAIMLWERYPGETLFESLKILAGALVGWLVVSLLAFAMFWLFFNLSFVFGRWVWERFYRTPTL